MKIIYIKIISNLSFIFIMVNFLLCLNSKIPVNEYVFLWMSIFYISLYLKNHLNKYTKVIIEILILLPIIFIKGTVSKIAIVFICSLIIYLYKQGSNKISYGETAEQFKKCSLLSIIIAVISWLKFGNYNISEFILPYVILYLVLTIMLLRYLRNYEYNAANKKMGEVNIIYSTSIMIATFILASKSIRNIIFKAILSTYYVIADTILYFFTLIFWGISYILNIIFKGVNFKALNSENIKIEIKKSPFDDNNINNTALSIRNPLFYRAVSIIINILLVVIVFIVLIKILKRNSLVNLKKEEFVETKEFIFDKKNHNKLKEKLNKLLTPSDYSSKIRYYYKKFIIDCIKKGISLNKSDTTMNINLKSKEAFNKISLSNMRDIYVQIRYSNKPCTKEQLKEFYQYYKKRNI